MTADIQKGPTMQKLPTISSSTIKDAHTRKRARGRVAFRLLDTARLGISETYIPAGAIGYIASRPVDGWTCVVFVDRVGDGAVEDRLLERYGRYL